MTRTTTDYINEIIDALTQPDAKLADILLKVKILAYKLDNRQLKEWVDFELKGYPNSDVPAYRIVPALPMGNMSQDLGLGGSRHLSGAVLPVDAVSQGFSDKMKEHQIASSVFELSHLLQSEGPIQVHLPVQVGAVITNKALANGWQIQNCWKELGRNSIEGILGSIKNHLLTFLLELSTSLGELEQLDVNLKSKRIDDMVKNTIGSISGQTVNVSFGDKVVQTGSSGSDNTVNVQAGDSNEMTIALEITEQVKELISELSSQLLTAHMQDEERTKIQEQLDLLGSEVMRERPTAGLLSATLNTLHGLMVGVAGNVLTPVVVEQVQFLATILTR